LLLAECRYGQKITEEKAIVSTSSPPFNHVSDYAPFYEIDAHWEESAAAATSPSYSKLTTASFIRENHERLGRRVFNTHLRWDMLPKRKEVEAIPTSTNNNRTYDIEEQSTNEADYENIQKVDNSSNHEHHDYRPQCGKFIYITRNQLDVVNSFYHHLSNQLEGTYTNNFETFIKDWMDGNKIPFGSSLHHLMSFAIGFANNSYDDTTTSSSSAGGGGDIDYDGGDQQRQQQQQPLLLLSYENLISNLKDEVLCIIHFLNLSHIPMNILKDEILPTFEFNSMKDNLEKFQPKSVGWLNGFQFLRKGVVGDGRRSLILMNKGGNDNNSNKDEEDKSSPQMIDTYKDWVKKEDYRSKISSMLEDSCLDECKKVFLSVVEL
jgi:hypothetical protein